MSQDMKVTPKEAALRALYDGTPSLLPKSNPWRSMMEQHRWGHEPDMKCPACAKEAQRHPRPTASA